jgi:hypothetical protein
MVEVHISPSCAMWLNPDGNSEWTRYCLSVTSPTFRSMALSNGKTLPSADKDTESGILIEEILIQQLGYSE